MVHVMLVDEGEITKFEEFSGAHSMQGSQPARAAVRTLRLLFLCMNITRLTEGTGMAECTGAEPFSMLTRRSSSSCAGLPRRVRRAVVLKVHMFQYGWCTKHTRKL
jgi:hypothetical protein